MKAPFFLFLGMDSETLVQRFKKGDIKAFELLYGQYSESIHGVIHTMLKDRERAQELCQDVFVKAWNNASSYDAAKGRFFTWLLNIARNTAIDEIRPKAHRDAKKNLPIHSFVDIVTGADADDKLKDPGQIKQLMAGLKQKCIDLIDLLFFRGYTQKEAAVEYDIPVGTIKTRLRACISQIRKNRDR